MEAQREISGVFTYLLVHETGLALYPTCRDAADFVVPVTGERVPVPPGLRVFATINPASIGGGRNQLPRSISGLLTRVRLAAPSDSELSAITLAVFAGCIGGGLIRTDHVAAVFRVHQEVVRAMAERSLGRGGGVQPFNLRDIIKVCHGIDGRLLGWPRPC